MKTIEATFQVVTPMFLGGEKHEASSIRPPSIKGALRFWWRALNWQKALAENGNDKNKALKWLHKEEARLFGAAAEEGAGGQGVFLLKVSSSNMQTIKAGTEMRGLGIQYMLGQGIWNHKEKLTREALKESQSFDVAIAFHPKNTHLEDIDTLWDVMSLFGLLGGLGSRARKGLGSVALEIMVLKDSGKEKRTFIAPKNNQDYVAMLKKIIGDVSSVSLPPYSAFSSVTDVRIIAETNEPLKVLEKVGSELQLYRSYGRNGKVNGRDAEQNFKDDHDNVLHMNFKDNKPPRRAVFGLPHNYFFSSTKTNVEVNPIVEKSELRRASPLCLHVHSLEGRYIGVHVLFEADFLPNEAKVKVKEKKQRNEKIVSSEVDFGVIQTYLDRYKTTTRILP